MSTWLALGVLAPLVGVLALAYRARARRQIAHLLARIERLENAWQAQAQGTSSPVTGPSTAGAGSAPHDPLACADVLAGRTSHIRRLIEGGGQPLRSLGDQAILAIYQHIGESFAPTDLAAALCVSLRTLERGLAHSLACTPRQLILTMKMREARRMLALGCRVVDVSRQLGFVNVFHFSRRFKSLYRFAPSRVRSGGPDPR